MAGWGETLSNPISSAARRAERTSFLGHPAHRRCSLRSRLLCRPSRLDGVSPHPAQHRGCGIFVEITRQEISELPSERHPPPPLPDDAAPMGLGSGPGVRFDQDAAPTALAGPAELRTALSAVPKMSAFSAHGCSLLPSWRPAESSLPSPVSVVNSAPCN